MQMGPLGLGSNPTPTLTDPDPDLDPDQNRLMDAYGKRILKLEDICSLCPKENLFFVPQGWHFQWPSVREGYSWATAVSASSSPAVVLTTLSTSPKVFQVENFVTEEEIEWFLQFGREHVIKRSRVGFSDGTTQSSIDETQRLPFYRDAMLLVS
jgi:hypothetical protein